MKLLVPLNTPWIDRLPEVVASEPPCRIDGRAVDDGVALILGDVGLGGGEGCVRGYKDRYAVEGVECVQKAYVRMPWREVRE